MADIITLINDDKQEIKNQLGELPDTFPVPQFFEDNIKLNQGVLNITTKDTSDSMIWGRDDWGTDWGTGALYVDTDYAILPYNNIFYEYLSSTAFIDGTSTATVSTSASTVTFTAGQILKSKTIAYLRSNINNITVLSGIDFTKGTFEVSNDDGSTWETVSTANTLTVFSTVTSSDKLKYRFTASDSYTLTAPIVIQLNA